MLGPVSPMDRPDPTETNRPQGGVHCAEQESANATAIGVSSSLCEPIRPRIQTRLDGGVVCLGDKK